MENHTMNRAYKHQPLLLRNKGFFVSEKIDFFCKKLKNLEHSAYSAC